MTERLRILVVDDEADSLLPVLAESLADRGYELLKESDPRLALTTLAIAKPDLVLLDLRFPGDDLEGTGVTTGGRLLTEIRRQFADLPVMVFTTCLDDADIPLEGFAEQPHARFAKPDFEGDSRWAESLDREIRETLDAVEFARQPPGFALPFVVGTSAEMAVVSRQVRLAARMTLNVLVYGETGTGKQSVAEAIHRLSGRSGHFKHFVCAGAGERELEVVLFGSQSAAAGGGAEGTGLLADASKGTLFLDEIQRMPLALQARLIELIEGGTTRRSLDDGSAHKVDARLIVATNHSLADLVADGYLLEEFAQRFSVLLISLPPLRRRLGDLPVLFEQFVQRANVATGRSILPVLRPETLAKLQDYLWPGNVHELENTLTRAVVNTTSNVLIPEDIDFGVVARKVALEKQPLSSASALSRQERALDGVADPSSADMTQVVGGLVDRALKLPTQDRHAFLRDATQGVLREHVLTELVRRLHDRFGRRVTHKDLLRELDPTSGAELTQEDCDRAIQRIRKFVNDSIRITDLDFNR